jgi:hypothetical protein
MKLRFSIARLVAVIVLCGVAFAATASPSNLWANATFTLALGVLVAGLVPLIVDRGRRRAFWFGFAVGGWAYFACAFGPWLADTVGPRLVTTAFLDIVYPHLVPAEPSPTPAMGGGNGIMGMGPSSGGMGSMDMGAMMGAMGRRMLGRTVSGGMGGPPPTQPTRWDRWTQLDRTPNSPTTRVGSMLLTSPVTFRTIGHSLFTLLIAYTTGVWARHRFDRRYVVSAPGG